MLLSFILGEVGRGKRGVETTAQPILDLIWDFSSNIWHTGKRRMRVCVCVLEKRLLKRASVLWNVGLGTDGMAGRIPERSSEQSSWRS